MRESGEPVSVKVVFEDSTDVEHIVTGDDDVLEQLGAYWAEVGNFLSGREHHLHVYDSLHINGRYVLTDESSLVEWAEANDDLHFDEMYDDA